MLERAVPAQYYKFYQSGGSTIVKYNILTKILPTSTLLQLDIFKKEKIPTKSFEKLKKLSKYPN